MHAELLEVLRCPSTSRPLALEHAEYDGGRIKSGLLTVGAQSYPIKDFIPRFVPASNYADNFGRQWNMFRETQLDSHSGHAISADRFWKATGWRADDLRGKWVLDVGCGAGRFAEIALGAGANVVALDYSGAVDACYANLKRHADLHVVQGDVYALPFARGFFQFVYSLGVLQHTPDVERAFAALPAMLADDGRLCVDYYWRRIRTLLHPKYVLRPITKRMSQERLFALLESNISKLLNLSRALRRVPVLGRALQRLVPVVDYSGIYPLSEEQLEEWALLDTFDMLAPQYDRPQTARTVRRWLEVAGLEDIAVFHEGHLVGRGRKRV